VKRSLSSVAATGFEQRERLPGDELLENANVVMTRAFTIAAPREVVWPWLQQLGKRRAGWYLPASVERFIPPSRRAIRRIDTRWQGLAAGDVIPDYGGKNETFTVKEIEPGRHLVYWSQRGHVTLTWAITLRLGDPPASDSSRVILRLRLQGVRHRRLATTVGEIFDVLTIAGMAAGLRERLNP
jgi:hypothetical protein